MVTFGQTPSSNWKKLPCNIAGVNMAQFDRAHWIATANIERFEEQLKAEADTCQRKLLQGLIVLEREKLKAIYKPDR